MNFNGLYFTTSLLISEIKYYRSLTSSKKNIQTSNKWKYISEEFFKFFREGILITPRKHVCATTIEMESQIFALIISKIVRSDEEIVRSFRKVIIYSDISKRRDLYELECHHSNFYV